MADGIEITVTGLTELARDLAEADDVAVREVRQVVSRGALNIKQEWQRRWSGIGHAPHIPRAVTYDTRFSGDSAEAEIGPDKGRRQGALGNILEFGTSKNAPIPGGLPALQHEEPKFVRALEDAGGKVLDG